MSIFDLAEMELVREKKEYNLTDILDYSVKIREYLDLQAEKREKTQFKKVS